jgi:hypothetical protein
MVAGGAEREVRREGGREGGQEGGRGRESRKGGRRRGREGVRGRDSHRHRDRERTRARDRCMHVISHNRAYGRASLCGYLLRARTCVRRPVNRMDP